MLLPPPPFKLNNNFISFKTRTCKSSVSIQSALQMMAEGPRSTFPSQKTAWLLNYIFIVNFHPIFCDATTPRRGSSVHLSSKYYDSLGSSKTSSKVNLFPLTPNNPLTHLVTTHKHTSVGKITGIEFYCSSQGSCSTSTAGREIARKLRWKLSGRWLMRVIHSSKVKLNSKILIFHSWSFCEFINIIVHKWMMLSYNALLPLTHHFRRLMRFLHPPVNWHKNQKVNWPVTTIWREAGWRSSRTLFE